jgi:protoporphyrinogen oxidase
MKKVDCIIIGAGLSGLAAALTLSRNDKTFVLIDKNPQVGGRVKSTHLGQQFILDHGFQIILSSYPELKKFIQIEELTLKKFNSGALIYNGTGLDTLGHLFLHPSILFSQIFSKLITFKDKYLTLKLVFVSLFKKSDTPKGTQSTKDFLIQFGFSEKMIKTFWNPFLTGVFLDSDLNVGKDYFLFLIKCFVTGRATLPALGMAELPARMAGQIPQNSIYLNETIKGWENNQITLSNGEIYTSDGVICAFDEDAHQELSYAKVTTFYFTSERLNQVKWDKWLVLIPREFNLSFDNMCVISQISPDYSQKSPLLSVSVVGDSRGSVDQIINDINNVAKFDLQLKLVSSFAILKALPRAPDCPKGFEIKGSVIYCGDRWTSPSINGALKSGRLAAEHFIKNGHSE